ncbi:MAG: hypothetical protein ACE5G2_02570 [Candidatus Krumholzibacteriia bacterium]
MRDITAQHACRIRRLARVLTTRRCSVLILAVLLAPRSAGARDLKVEIQVQRLLPAGVPDLPYSTKVVTAGVPLALEDAVSDVAQLGVLGASAAQFRALHRDPESRMIRWVLVDFVADRPHGSFALVRGSGAFGGPDLAADLGKRIVVDTGPARFEIRKYGFNLLDRVVRRGAELVAPHDSGGLLVVSGGTRYASGFDPGSETFIEENGPVKAVVLSRGTLRSASGEPHLAYTARLHFYRGQSACRAFVTLRNGEIASLSAKTFDAAWVELPLQLGADRQVTFGARDASFSGALRPADTAHLFQGDNTYQRSGRTARILHLLTPAEGLEVAIADSLHHALGSTADVAPGWMRLQDDANAILAGMRDFATLFPSGFDVRGNLLGVEIFSRHNPMSDLIFSWGAHETREILFEFAAPGAAPEPFHYRLQFPLLGLCDFARYRDTGAIYGERRLVTADEERLFFQELGETWEVTDLEEADIELDRQYSFGTTGGSNQFDQDLCHLLDFLRTGFAGRFQQARLGVLWKADQAVLHSDDFDYGTHQNGVSDVDVQRPKTFHGKGAGSTFDDEHPHWVCMPLYYWLTGDERVREAIEDYGEWRRYRAGNPTFGAIHGGAIGHFRLWSRAFRDVALLYEITGQQRYLGDLRRMAEVLTLTVEQGSSRGRNLERGYFFFGKESDANRRIHLFFLTEMNPIGVREAMRVLPRDDPWREELRDYLYGLAYFTLREAQVTPEAIGYPYGYFAAVPNPDPGTRGDQTGLVLTHGYEMSGDLEFVERARALTWRVAQYQHRLRASELSTHVRIHRWIHRDEVGALLIEPDVQPNADGSYALRWTAPTGAREYIVKYGPRPLTENLDFDQLARTYRFDPQEWMNFWAATNVSGEPPPGPAGTQESYTTPVLPPGTWFFKVKALTGTAMPSTGEPAPAPDRPRREAAVEDARSGVGLPRVYPSLAILRGSKGIRFENLPPHSRVRIYNVAGRLVRELDGAGRSLVWDRRSASRSRVAHGVYLYRIDTGPTTIARGRLVLIR